MNCQSARPFEGLAANIAFVGTRVTVSYKVTFEEIPRPEEFRADLALIKRLAVRRRAPGWFFFAFVPYCVIGFFRVGERS